MNTSFPNAKSVQRSKPRDFGDPAPTNKTLITAPLPIAQPTNKDFAVESDEFHYFAVLPLELWYMIWGWLPIDTLLRVCGVVCQAWHTHTPLVTRKAFFYWGGICDTVNNAAQRYNALTPAIPAIMGHLPNIRQLGLYNWSDQGVQLQVDGSKTLNNLPQLLKQTLPAQLTDAFTTKGSLPGLQLLAIVECRLQIITYITAHELVPISEVGLHLNPLHYTLDLLPITLTTLVLDRCNFVSFKAIANLLGLECLVLLQIAMAPKDTQFTWENFTLPASLQSLSLDSSLPWHDPSLSHLSNLVKLKLHNTRKVRGVCLRHMPRLQELILCRDKDYTHNSNIIIPDLINCWHFNDWNPSMLTTLKKVQLKILTDEATILLPEQLAQHISCPYTGTYYFTRGESCDSFTVKSSSTQ